MIRRTFWNLVAILILAQVPVLALEPNCDDREISDQEIISHIRFLSSDELRGRMSGTQGAEKAANYIASEFAKARLKPLGDNDSYFQNFDFTKEVVLGSRNNLELKINNNSNEYELGKDFSVLSLSSSGEVEGELVFAGYGISALDIDYDDYSDLDVTDKVVMVLRYTPEGYEQDSLFYDYAALRYKAMNAREKGAKAIIFVTPYSQVEEDDLNTIGRDYSYSDSGIQSLIIRRDKAEEIFSEHGKNLKDLELNLSNKTISSFVLSNTKAKISSEVLEQRGESSNVIGLIEGTDPVLKDEFIVIGAHYDHIGLGQRNSRSEERSSDSIHNGADDNASGVAGLIELAKLFSCRQDSLNRSLVFIAFSAEELGLIGASYYVDNPKVPIANTVAMINMDMIGRLDDDKLTVFGVGSSPEWKELIKSSNAKFDFELSLNNSGFAPSDQSVFFAKEVPVLHFFTGLHDDYHTPGDDWEKINSEGQKKVLLLMSDLIMRLDTQEDKVAFTNIEEPKKASSKFNVYLGTIPDYSNQIEGVKLMGVRNGSPADKAGLKDDDTIVEYNGKQIKNLYDYVYALGDSKPGIPTSLVVIRNYKPLSLIIVPESKAQEIKN